LLENGAKKPKFAPKTLKKGYFCLKFHDFKPKSVILTINSVISRNFRDFKKISVILSGPYFQIKTQET